MFGVNNRKGEELWKIKHCLHKHWYELWRNTFWMRFRGWLFNTTTMRW